MLPQSLSSDACSLDPGVERLAVTAEIVLGADGRGRARRASTAAGSAPTRGSTTTQLDGSSPGARAPPERGRRADRAGPRGRRGARASAARGAALEVSSSEPEFEFDADGEVAAADAVAQTEAHRLIEQLMILTNEQVAELLERRRVPTLYRVHEQPDPARVERPGRRSSPRSTCRPRRCRTSSPARARPAELVVEASRLVAREAERRGHGARGLSSLVLRSLKPACYSERNLGHAGLGSPAYAHFTSPIRRYPDLIAHRALLSRSAAARTSPSAAEVREARPCTAPSASATRCGSSATPTTSAPPSCSSASSSSAARSTPFEGEVSGRDRRRRVHPLRRRARRRLRGLLPGPADARRALRDQRGRDRAGRRARAAGGPDRRRGRGAGRRDRGAARARRPGARPGEVGGSDEQEGASARLASGDVATNRARAPQVRDRRELRGRDRAARHRGQVAARRQGARSATPTRRSRTGRSGCAAPTSRPTPRRATTTSPSARASCSCTAARSSG